MLTQFYHGLFRKYTIAFGNLFNDIQVRRANSANTTIQNISVPISYGPKQGFLTRLAADPKLDKEVAITVPRIGFEITTVDYDGQRSLTKKTFNVKYGGDNDRLRRQFTHVPYNINYQLSIFSKNSDDAFQIIEQIVPYFTPDFTISIDVIEEMGISMDIPVILNGLSVEDAYNQAFTDRRVLIWNLDFTMKGYFYGPVSNVGVIKRADIYSYATPTDQDFNTGEAVSHQYRVTPGLLANGSPTTNVDASIPYQQVDAEDDYGFAQEYFFYTDGNN